MGLLLIFLLNGLAFMRGQENNAASAIKIMRLQAGKNRYYEILYKPDKPGDVPQEIYDGLWEIQKEVIDNFTYDFAIKYGRKKSPYGYTPAKDDYYKHGSGVCEDYSNFFILLAREKSLTENLYKVSGNSRHGGHAWLEYRTAENVYIIDPTWSDDYSYEGRQVRQRFRETPAYGKEAFFITYDEDKIIFSQRRQSYNHSTFTGKTEIKLRDDKAAEIER
jgi:hypothetical protein